jgi:hypothetical protein
LADAGALAEGCGFELLRASGQGTQYFWLWFLKPKWPWIPKAIRNKAFEASTAMRSAIEKPVTVAFSLQHVRAGDSYRVRIPGFAGKLIDIGYELVAGQCSAPETGVVWRWCELDSRAEALIRVPREHPTGAVRITKVRSRARGSRWRRAEGTIHVAGSDEPRGRRDLRGE